MGEQTAKRYPPLMPERKQILLAAQRELARHAWTTFIDDPPSMAQGGKGVVLPGCPTCQKRIHTTGEYVRHLIRDVLPVIVDNVLKSIPNRS
jgi:hypothetical protein